MNEQKRTRILALSAALVALAAGVACGAQATPAPTAAVSTPPSEVSGTSYSASIETLTTNGGRVSWSHDGKWIYFDRLEPDGFWDVYRIHPDGSEEACLTCDAPDLPNRHQGQPEVHPDGRYLLFQAEKAQHAGKPGQWSTNPGGGVHNDLWVLDLETGGFYQLTDVRSGTPAGGSLHAHFSQDGHRLLWADYEGSSDNRFHDWRIVIADFVADPEPHLENYQYLDPGPQPMWMETHGWGPADAWIYFTCTPVEAMHDHDMDICRIDLDNPTEMTRLTLTSGRDGEPGEWDEHAHLSPGGELFSWMSSAPYSTEGGTAYGQWLRTDLWLMDVDGSNQQRITFFNDVEPAIVADQDWNPAADGLQLAVTVRMVDRGEIHIKIIDISANR
jgi:Tol biopolymer transport system component